VTGNRRAARQQLATAYHEAGHAVAALQLGLSVKAVTIEPAEDHLGLTTFKKLRGLTDASIYAMPPRVRYRFEAAAVTALAGDIAERLVLKRPSGGGSDRNIVYGYVLSVVGSEEQASAYINWLSVWSKGIVTVFRPSVEAVANALVDRVTLTGAEVRRLAFSIPPSAQP
jgi:hypothetical protein